jgi:adenylate cyclase
MERRLAAIMATDVVGYTRLMEADEVGTLAALKSHREELIDPTIADHRGRIVKLMGDGSLVEFASVVDAVEAAVAIQRGMAERNARIPEDRQIALRIGVNLGDIIIDDDDIYGDGVNIAARLEALAEPGGICLSRPVRDQIRDKLPYELEDKGEIAVKNITRPVRTFQIRAAAEFTKNSPQAKPEPPADRPSIAVLPFANLSTEAEQAFLADGITEDIITALSKIPDLAVIARNSTFAYKGKAVDVRTVARELGVRYILEGGMQRSGTRLRVTAQLIDAETGHHLWAERYDSQEEQIFELQDSIARNITTALQGKLTWGETSALWAGGTRDFKAWEAMAQAMDYWYRFTPSDNLEVRRLVEQAIAIDPDFGSARILLAWTYYFEFRYGNIANPNQAIMQAEQILEKVLASGEVPAQAYHLKSALHMNRREHDEATAAIKRAIELAPGNAEFHGWLGYVLVFAGSPAKAVLPIQTAMKLSPRYPDFLLWALIEAYRWTGGLDDALARAKELVANSPDNYLSYVKLASILAEMGRKEDAKRIARKILELNPDFSTAAYGRSQSYADPKQLRQVLAGLRNAGLPE